MISQITTQLTSKVCLSEQNNADRTFLMTAQATTASMLLGAFL